MINALLLSTLIFGTSVSCLSVTSPANGSELDTSRETTVVWSFSDNDPAYFNLYLINDDRVPSISVEIASNVTTSTGSYTFDGVDVVPSSGYRFTLKDTSNDDLLTESDTFIIVSKGDDTTTVTSGTSTSTTSTTAYSESTSATTASGSTDTTDTTTTTATTSSSSSSRTDSASSTSQTASSSASQSSSSSTSYSLGTVSQKPSSAIIAGLVVLVFALTL